MAEQPGSGGQVEINPALVDKVLQIWMDHGSDSVNLSTLLTALEDSGLGGSAREMMQMLIERVSHLEGEDRSYKVEHQLQEVPTKEFSDALKSLREQLIEHEKREHLRAEQQQLITKQEQLWHEERLQQRQLTAEQLQQRQLTAEQLRLRQRQWQQLTAEQLQQLTAEQLQQRQLTAEQLQQLQQLQQRQLTAEQLQQRQRQRQLTAEQLQQPQLTAEQLQQRQLTAEQQWQLQLQQRQLTVEQQWQLLTAEQRRQWQLTAEQLQLTAEQQRQRQRQLIAKQLQLTAEQQLSEHQRKQKRAVNQLHTQKQLTALLDRKPVQALDAWKAAYEEALEKQGSVSVKVTRCLFIGPPGVGKSSLKHLLIHNKSKAVQISTPVMDAPDVIRITSEQYALKQGSSSWQLMEGEAIRHAVQLSALCKNYQASQPSRNILKTAHQANPDSSTSEDTAIQSSQPNHKLQGILSQFLSSTENVEDSVILNNASFLHILDSGGQPCFLDVLPLLLSVPCSYVLVFNASQDLDQPLPVTYRPRENSTQVLKSNQTGRELTQRMMSSFHTMGVKHAKDMEHFQAPGTSSPQPSIHLIGTFKDVLLRENRLEEQKKNHNKAFESLSHYPAFRYLTEDEHSNQSSFFYLVNNNMTDEEECSPAEFKYIQHLRSSLSQSKAALRLNVPLLWYLLQQIVSKTDRKLFPYSELKEFAMACRLVNSEKHFFSFVKLFHMLGFFTFFEFSPTSSKESALVCTDTSFFCQEASKILSIQFAKVHSRESRSFQSTGVLGPSSHTVLEELNISKKMDQAWLLKSLVHTGIAAKIDEVSEKLFIPAALPFKEIHSPQASYSVATLCASFKVQEDSFSREFMILHQGVFCKLAVKLASNPLSQCKVIPSESFRSSIKFLCENSHIHLMENINFLEIAVTFEESFPSIAAYSDLLEKAHQCCSNVLKMIKTAVAKVSDDMFGPSSIDVGEVVVGFKCTCGADLPHMAVVDEKNLSLRCIGGKKENRLQKLSLNQLVWFRQLAHDGQAQLTLQGTENSKCYVLQEVSTDAPMPPPCPPCLDQNLDDALVALLPELRTGLSLEGLLSRLERPAGGFMTKTERAKVQALPNPLDRVSEIVDILRKKSNEDFCRFLAILDKSGNELWTKTLCARISLDATPSDSAIQEVAIRLKEDSFAVAVLIGVPFEVTDRLETVRNGGMKALKHWLDGQCDPQYPISWSSLLSAVEKVAGAETASELKREVQLNSTWSKLPPGKPKM